jgi:hypothetical protein
MLSIEEIKLLIEKLEKVKKEDFQELIDSNLQVLKELESAVDANNSQEIDRLDKTVEWFKMDLEHKQKEPVVDNWLFRMVQTNILPELEEKIFRRFRNPRHRKYLKFFLTRKHECHNIPQNSCNFVFSWDTFVFFTQNHIQHYLHDMKRVLIPGGYAFIQYADCHYDFDLTQAKRGYWNYNTKSAM